MPLKRAAGPRSATPERLPTGPVREVAGSEESLEARRCWVEARSPAPSPFSFFEPPSLSLPRFGGSLRCPGLQCTVDGARLPAGGRGRLRTRRARLPSSEVRSARSVGRKLAYSAPRAPSANNKVAGSAPLLAALRPNRPVDLAGSGWRCPDRVPYPLGRPVQQGRFGNL